MLPSEPDLSRGDKVVLRSRGTVKVVWRSGKHLRCSFGKGQGKAQKAGREDASGSRGVGVGGRQEEGQAGLPRALDFSGGDDAETPGTFPAPGEVG